MKQYSAEPGQTAATVRRNTLWSGIEAGAGLVTAFLVSIAIARTFGPARMGYFNFVLWVCGISASLGSLGIPATTAKYMAEYLGRDQRGVARSVFFVTLRAQAMIATCVAAAAAILVLTVFDPAYRTISLVIVAGIVPQMVSYIPSQANNAAERLRANVPGAVAGMGVYAAGVTISLVLGWDLLGVAVSTFLCHVTELTLKLSSVLPWVTSEPAAAVPAELRIRMFRFSRKSFALMVLNLVVWDRSDIFFLKWLSPDIRQVAFFSLPFSLVERALLAPQVLAGAIAATLFAEYGRSHQRMLRIAELALRYVLICGVPLLFGLAALGKGVVGLLYGAQYAPAAGVLATVALLGVAKSTLYPVQAVYSATERLRTVLMVACIGGAIDILLDVLLIPRFGALGAAIANGTAQVYAAASLWFQASRTWRLNYDLKTIRGVLLCGATMAAVIAPLAWLLRPIFAVALGGLIGVIVYAAMLRTIAVVSPADGARILHSWPAIRRSPLLSRMAGLVFPEPSYPAVVSES